MVYRVFWEESRTGRLRGRGAANDVFAPLMPLLLSEQLLQFQLFKGVLEVVRPGLVTEYVRSTLNDFMDRQ